VRTFIGCLGLGESVLNLSTRKGFLRTILKNFNTFSLQNLKILVNEPNLLKQEQFPQSEACDGRIIF
jgi:hypothetical protein